MSGSRAKIIRRIAWKYYQENRYSIPGLRLRNIYRAMKKAHVYG